MKKILLFISLSVLMQQAYTQVLTPTKASLSWNRGQFDVLLNLPSKCDTNFTTADRALLRDGSYFFNHCDSNFYFFYSNKWRIQPGKATQITDSSFVSGGDTIVIRGTGGGSVTLQQALDFGSTLNKDNTVDFDGNDLIFSNGNFDLRDVLGFYLPWANFDPGTVEGTVYYKNSTSRFRGRNFTGWDNFVMEQQLKDTAAALRASGGGGGSGTVNSGAANRLTYYPSSGTTVDDLAAITANRSLISDANGLPTHSATTSTELGYVNGVTSAIQTQLNGKAATSHTHTESDVTGLVSDLAAKEATANKNVNNGYAGLNNTGHLAYAQLDTTHGTGLVAWPGLIADRFNPIQGTGMTITGTYPNITFNSSGGGSQSLAQVTSVGANTTTPTIFDSLYAANQLSKEGITVGDSLSLFSDSLLWAGTSLTYDKEASGHSNSFAYLTSKALGAVEINKGVPGTTLSTTSGNSIFDRLGDIYTYRSTLRNIFVELGTNDRPLSASDTIGTRTLYIRLLDTVIARGWPLNKIVMIISPPIGSTTTGFSTFPLLIAMERHVAAEKGVVLVDAYAYLNAHGGQSNIFSDSLHLNNLGHLNVKKATIATLKALGAKTNGYVLVNGEAEIKSNTSIGGYSTFSKAMEINNTTINTAILNLRGPSFSTGNQYSELRFTPHKDNPQNDSIIHRYTIESGYRARYDIMANIKSIFSYSFTNDRIILSESDSYLNETRLAINGQTSIKSTAAPNTDLIRLYTYNGFGSVGQYNNIWKVLQTTGGSDSFTLKYLVGPGYANYIEFQQNTTPIWRVNHASAAIPFEIVSKASFNSYTFHLDTASFSARAGYTQNLHSTFTKHSFIDKSWFDSVSALISGLTTVAFGSTPNNNGGSISGVTLTLQPADGTHPGGVSTTTQSMAGVKTFLSIPVVGTASAHDNSTKAASTAYSDATAAQAAHDSIIANSDVQYTRPINTTNSTPATIDSINAPTNTVTEYEVTITSQSGSDVAVYRFRVGVKNISDVQTMVGGSAIDLGSSEDSGLTGASTSFAIAGNYVVARVTGIASTSIDWKITYKEITHQDLIF
jgi:lysophospholipase L1-like esterase